MNYPTDGLAILESIGSLILGDNVTTERKQEAGSRAMLLVSTAVHNPAWASSIVDATHTDDAQEHDASLMHRVVMELVRAPKAVARD